jgi:hypothetical protein
MFVNATQPASGVFTLERKGEFYVRSALLTSPSRERLGIFSVHGSDEQMFDADEQMFDADEQVLGRGRSA